MGTARLPPNYSDDLVSERTAQGWLLCRLFSSASRAQRAGGAEGDVHIHGCRIDRRDPKLTPCNRHVDIAVRNIYFVFVAGATCTWTGVLSDLVISTDTMLRAPLLPRT